MRRIIRRIYGRQDMSIGMSLLAILDEGPTYGLRLKNEFEAGTAAVWPLNVGQVYATLGRLERAGLVTSAPETNEEGQRVYEISDLGRSALASWFGTPTDASPPPRDELVLKLVMAARDG